MTQSYPEMDTSSQQLSLPQMDSANLNLADAMPLFDTTNDEEPAGELSENDVDLLMDALDDDDKDSTKQPSENPLEAPVRSSSDGSQLRYSFSLPIVGFDEENQDDAPEEEQQVDDEDEDSEEDNSEDATEPASISDEPVLTASSSVPTRPRELKRTLHQEITPENKAAKLETRLSKDAEWDEARAVSHLLSSPYDSSFGLMSRIDTR